MGLWGPDLPDTGGVGVRNNLSSFRLGLNKNFYRGIVFNSNISIKNSL